LLRKKSKIFITMRKLFALLLVAGMFTVVACDSKKEETTENTETTTTETTVDSTSMEAAPAMADSSAMAPADTTKK
jgi:hypothetical protein